MGRKTSKKPKKLHNIFRKEKKTNGKASVLYNVIENCISSRLARGAIRKYNELKKVEQGKKDSTTSPLKEV
jgi:hypothetical protein